MLGEGVVKLKKGRRAEFGRTNGNERQVSNKEWDKKRGEEKNWG